MDLDAYLDRIDYGGPVAPDLETLIELHRHHLYAIPYENLDVQLRRPLDLDPDRIFDKLVNQRRGGWCYEMNGLFEQALIAIGFDVTRLAGAVMRDLQGEEAIGNHLVLRVDFEVPWIADVGLGDGTLDPYPLKAGAYAQVGRNYVLESLSHGEWRWQNHEGLIPPSFDFNETPDDASLIRACQHLQDDPASLFRENLIVMRRQVESSTCVLIGRVLAQPGEQKRVIADAGELEAVLAEEFGIEDPEIDALWGPVAARHEQLFGADAQP